MLTYLRNMLFLLETYFDLLETSTLAWIKKSFSPSRANSWYFKKGYMEWIKWISKSYKILCLQYSPHVLYLPTSWQPMRLFAWGDWPYILVVYVVDLIRDKLSKTIHTKQFLVTIVIGGVLTPCRSFSNLFPFRVSVSGLFRDLSLMSMGIQSAQFPIFMASYIRTICNLCINTNINCLHRIMLRFI